MIRKARKKDHSQLVGIWERAVRATHNFVSETDIAFFRPKVADDWLPLLETYIFCKNDNDITGFISIADNLIEMLFVEPDSHSQGIGRALLNLVALHHDVLFVDVNEQNTGGVQFYKKYGFIPIGRSETDQWGNHYPLIHMKYRLES